jgi:hypothetical protein
MDKWIKVRGARYYPVSTFLNGEGSTEAIADIQSRQSFVSAKNLRLDQSSGVYVSINGNNLLLVIDRRTIQPLTAEWRFIGLVAERLAGCCANLSAQGQAALSSLVAVVFSTSPARSYADVKPNTFVYDTDEFRRSDGSLISAAYAASNIVHDANHIWMYDHRLPHQGQDAEIICWQLQVDNREALGLDETEVSFLESLIGDPSQVAARIEQDPYMQIQRLACSALGKCAVTANA